ncbi:hypothetical protein DPMN_191769 [Dreissena polymorpha]|uniref:Uncharacterized protein n=1 Tax=Dreissena polymorpha TaxID=45954 RepID=A0A9D3XZZ9_DREPO|nr:hypothetical protein DPMN_191769 [Dreissena polymorpha]
MIVRNSADQVQCAGPRPVLPSIERIVFYAIKCSSTWLHSLFSTLLTCDHEVVCELGFCNITPCAKSVSFTIQTGKHTLNMYESFKQSLSSLKQLQTLSIELAYDRLGVWFALHGLNIKCLTLSCMNKRLELTYVESLSQSLSSLKQLETLSIEFAYDSPDLC